MTTHPEAEIIVDEDVPLVRIIREFDAPAAKVYRAHVDPELFVRWIGPDYLTSKAVIWDARTGGSYRYSMVDGDRVEGFNGVFHELRENELIVQTFSWEGMPDGVALEKAVFEDLPGGRSRLTTTSLVDSFEARDSVVASGMEVGIVQGYNTLDDLLAG
ncbi:MAG TPA: SRPBCC family protein [Pseudolysinimonas sp.]